jgi:hypothetical protein
MVVLCLRRTRAAFIHAPRFAASSCEREPHPVARQATCAKPFAASEQLGPTSSRCESHRPLLTPQRAPASRLYAPPAHVAVSGAAPFVEQLYRCCRKCFDDRERSSRPSSAVESCVSWASSERPNDTRVSGAGPSRKTFITPKTCKAPHPLQPIVRRRIASHSTAPEQRADGGGAAGPWSWCAPAWLGVAGDRQGFDLRCLSLMACSKRKLYAVLSESRRLLLLPLRCFPR